MTRPVVACLLTAGVLLFSGCTASAQEPREPEAAATPARGRAEQGLATYYADSLSGNKTASGERYNPKELTAAHRTLPFGTVVQVTRKDGRSVRVRINDRGPFGGKKRIIDLSKAAAKELDMLKDGVVSVTITVVR
ncbi:MAG: septal ring lytic transglycosylase RlpA family protein [Polyangiaceae bacterium]|nr:septal ring lytic transglycosylase RlpA family protein [Polyangiaceae bacterium]